MAWRYDLPKCPVSPADRGEFMKPPFVHLGTSVDIKEPDREQIAALLFVTRFPHRVWMEASLTETAIAYKQADVLMKALALTRPQRGGGA